MLDLESAPFKRSLSETIAWCANRPAGANHAGSDAIRRRRALYAQSEQQLQEARVRASRGWFRRKVVNTKQWRQAVALLKQIRDSLGPLEHRLRSANLKPDLDLSEIRTDSLWAEVVAEVVAKRSQLMSKISPKGCSGNEAGGRLLLYNPNENLACGAGEHSSNGFFDVNNVPPWDIWIDFSEGTLISWVPPTLVDVAQMGIDVNPEACIRWADPGASNSSESTR
jgi:hypothetical protein